MHIWISFILTLIAEVKTHYEIHNYTCRLSELVWISHHVDIQSTATQIILRQNQKTASPKQHTHRQRKLVVHVRSAIHTVPKKRYLSSCTTYTARDLSPSRFEKCKDHFITEKSENYGFHEFGKMKSATEKYVIIFGRMALLLHLHQYCNTSCFHGGVNSD